VSIRALLRRWPIASWLFVIHAFIVLAFYVWWLLSAANPYNDMGWLIMAFVDFPIFFAYLPLVNHASGHLFALVAIVFGGVEWALIGLVFDLAWRSISRKPVLRGTKNDLTNR
jgi:hypothetical protein